MAKRRAHVVTITQPSVLDFFKRIPDEDAARRYFEAARWPAGVSCIHCGNADVWRVRDGRLFTCKSCRKQFTVRTGTVMEDSKIPIQKWLYAMYLMTVARKSISSVQLAKELGVTQKSAWFMAHRIRESCQSAGLLSGTVECDETYVGGKARNMHRREREQRIQGRGGVGKAIVFGAKSRDGAVCAKVIETAGGAELHSAVRESVSQGSTLYTDQHRGYLADSSPFCSTPSPRSRSAGKCGTTLTRL